MHLGDSLAGLRSLADRSVDVVITDPPYEAEAHTLQRRQKMSAAAARRYKRTSSVGVAETPLDFAPMTVELRDGICAEIGRVSRHRAVVFCQAEAVLLWRDALDDGGLPYRRSIPWVKPDAMPSLHGRWPGQSYEAIVLAVRAGSTCPVGGKAVEYRMCREYRGTAEAPHPTTKPLALMRELIADFTEPGDLVLDAFAGSGTTGVACLQLGRRFLGFELDPGYFEIACRRLRGDEARPRREQPGLFDALRSNA